MKKLILTALDDDHKLYYDCFIPFILSLKETDFTGDIGIISYGLSDSKEKILRDQGIRVFSGSCHVRNILVDRHISASDIAERYKYDLVAIYDADIWFPEPKLTIFETLKNSTALYCAYDIYRCTFLTNCVVPESIAEINHKIDQVIKHNHGYVWQAGLIAAHQTAWIKYRNYILTELQSNKFRLDYGIDSTILNLYALAQDGNIEHLPERYNCLPPWGIMIGFDAGVNRHRHYLNGELVEGIHVTRAHRETGEFSYLKWHEDHYYNKANYYRDKDYPYYNITRESLISAPDRIYSKPPKKLTLVDAQANVMAINYEGDNTCFEVQGDSKFTLQNCTSGEIILYFHWRSVMNFELIKNVYIVKDHRIFIKYHTNTYITLAPMESVSFVTLEPDVASKRICWCLESVRII
ncbi:hypothetical protein RYD26_05375 [Pasteurellaceae bacterium LIM206]|nr:hypothetical protein [Pasteurellaceae bacterium LIM206]